ncbi:MAG: GTPase HflX [Magnetovibrionaceae bacterium]
MGERCIVIHPDVTSDRKGSIRDADARLDEIAGLAEAIGLKIIAAEIVRVAKPKPSTYIGTGSVERIADAVGLDENPEDTGRELESTEGLNADVVVVDTQLSPIQQRNLERAWKTKVIDRTGLILEIFGARARTREGRLQVDLAQLTYQRGRLVRSWTHLERQRGGAGFMGGPGESQIEIDRRLIDQKVVRLKRELADVKRTRTLHRDARKRVPHPVVALVGYTNAGKSTLFNRMTEAEVLAKDQLFATLDPTMRALDLPSGRRVILSDTVGFVSDLPHELVEAFHATLEEVREADIILHVRDISHPDTEAQREDVLTVLKDLDIDEQRSDAMIDVLNKIDRLDGPERDIVINRAMRDNRDVILVSAMTGEGTLALMENVDHRLGINRLTIKVLLGHSDGAGISWLYDHGEVLDRLDDEEGCHLTIRIEPADLSRLKQSRPDLSIEDTQA